MKVGSDLGRGSIIRITHAMAASPQLESVTACDFSGYKGGLPMADLYGCGRPTLLQSFRESNLEP